MRLLSMSAVVPPFLESTVRGDISSCWLSCLFFPAMSSYIALQSTGSTTFTEMAGVKKELKIGIPLYFMVAGISLVFLLVYKVREWGS